METASGQEMEALYRAAIGAKKADFYVPKFIRFDQGASRLSWNWPAFFVAFYWCLYRRMYAAWAIYCVFIPVTLAFVSGMIADVVGGVAGNWLYSVVLIGYHFGLLPAFANSLYHRSVRKRIESLRLKVPETQSQLLVLNNISPTSGIVWVFVPMVGVALIGILAAIAIPAYQDYTIRAQVIEAFPLTDPVKKAVAEHYQSTKSWPASIQALDISGPMSGMHVAEASVDKGTISVTFSNKANFQIARHQLSFRPTLSDSGAINWTCGYAKRAEESDAMIGANRTSIKMQFLPMACR